MDNKQSRNIKAASFSVLALCFCSLLVFLSQQSPVSEDQRNAFARMEIYADKLIEKKFMSDAPAAKAIGRGLASLGTPHYGQEMLEGPVGLDPWGYPFNFLVKKDPQNPKSGVIVMWSSGADNKLETSRDMIAENHHEFVGDDFGKVIPFKL